MLPPVVERELRVALLRRKARAQWLKAARMAGAITLFFLVLLALHATRQLGTTLFHVLFILACASIVTRGFSLTADLLSEERRNGTLGLLVLTGLSPLEIFTHKLLGAVFLTAYGLLGALPFFAIPFLAGGVSATQFICALVFLANALLFCISVGLLGSALHREGGQAQITAVAIAAVLCLALPVGGWISQFVYGNLSLSQEWLTPSPAYGGCLIFGRFIGNSLRLFWSSSGFMLAYSLTALLLAAAVLQRTWRDGPETLAPKAWRDRWQHWARENRNGQPRRPDLLARNPFSWLAARDRGPVIAAGCFLAVGTAVWGALFLLAGGQRFVPSEAFFASILVHQVLNWILAYAAGKRLAEQRQTGGFEILLTTPLEVSKLIDGQNRGLIIQFKTVWVMVFALDAVFIGSGFTTGGWDMPAIISYVCIWAILLFLWFAVHLETAARAMWIAAWTGRPGYAALHAVRARLWILFGLWFLWPGGLGRSPRGYEVMVFIIALVVISLALGLLSSRRHLREKLTRELRDIACAPIPPRGDKRFRGWNPKLIHPPAKWAYFELDPVTRKATRPPGPTPTPYRHG